MSVHRAVGRSGVSRPHQAPGERRKGRFCAAAGGIDMSLRRGLRWQPRRLTSAGWAKTRAGRPGVQSSQPTLTPHQGELA